MAKVADVELMWTKSPSSDIVKLEMELTLKGSTTTVKIDNVSQETYTIEVEAKGEFKFKLKATDDEGNVVSSEEYSGRVGDLELPLPPTNLGHRIVGVRDVPDLTPTPA